MKSNLDPVFADSLAQDEPGPCRFWAPALVAASLASWLALLSAAKLLTVLV